MAQILLRFIHISDTHYAPLIILCPMGGIIPPKALTC
jgi:hypothetical protein